MKNEPQTIIQRVEKSSPAWSVVGFVVVLGTAFLGLAIGELQNRYPNTNMMVIFALLSLVTATTAYFYGSLVKRTLVEQNNLLCAKFTAMELAVSRYSIGVDASSESMLSQLEFIHFESTFSGNEIWVISSSLENDDPGTGPYHHVVQANLQRGVRYRYFYPDIALASGRVTRIKASFNDFSAQIFWHPLPIDVFRLHVGKNMGVYRNTATGSSDLSFVEIQFDKTIRWAKLDDTLTVDLVGWLTQHMDTMSGSITSNSKN